MYGNDFLNLYSSSFAPNNESHFPKHICDLFRENRKRESYFPSKGNWVPHICAPTTGIVW
jgi:hypothetical protein